MVASGTRHSTYLSSAFLLRRVSPLSNREQKKNKFRRSSINNTQTWTFHQSQHFHQIKQSPAEMDAKKKKYINKKKKDSLLN